MKRKTWLSGVLAAAMLFPCAAFAQHRGGQGGAAKGKFGGRAGAAGSRGENIPFDIQYDLMVKELKPPADQLARLKQKLDAAKDALAKWDRDNGFSADDSGLARRGFGSPPRAAAGPRGADANDPAKADDPKSALLVERNKLVATLQANVESLLTPEQKLTWTGFKLNRAVNDVLRAVVLTDDQMTKIRALADQTAADLLKTSDDDTQADIRERLLEDIKIQILTEEQRRDLETGGITGTSPKQPLIGKGAGRLRGNRPAQDIAPTQPAD